MIDKLIGALAESIRNAFGEIAEVYTESVHQNALKPCFFVECENAERIEMLNRSFFVRVHAKIIYENDEDEKRREAESITAEMFDLLSFIRVEDKIFNGRKIHGRWEDGRMVIRAVYDVWQEKEKEACELMKTIEVKGTYDGGIYEG